MKFLTLVILLSSHFAMAASFDCVSEKNKYTIKATYNKSTQIISSLTFTKGQELVAAFTNLPFTIKTHSVLFSSKEKVRMDVEFPNDHARYLSISREARKGAISTIGYGEFIPTNSIFSLEHHITCQFQD